MPRTTSELVVGVLKKDYDTKGRPDLDPYIVAASAVVDAAVQIAVQKSKPLADAQWKIVETWLAAHFYAINDRTYKSKNSGASSASFDGNTSDGFGATMYGQSAMRIDTSGALVNIDKRQFASAVWLGKAL